MGLGRGRGLAGAGVSRAHPSVLPCSTRLPLGVPLCLDATGHPPPTPRRLHRGGRLMAVGGLPHPLPPTTRVAGIKWETCPHPPSPPHSPRLHHYPSFPNHPLSLFLYSPQPPCRSMFHYSPFPAPHRTFSLHHFPSPPSHIGGGTGGSGRSRSYSPLAAGR